MKQAAVLGIGNRLMGDDGIGNDIVEEIKRRNVFPGFRLIVGETDTDYCLDELKGADLVILIDAAYMGEEPCSVTVISLKDILEEGSYAQFPHHFDLIHALKQENYQGEGMLLAVEACSIRYQLGLSSQMEAEFPRIVEEIIRHIKNFVGV